MKKRHTETDKKAIVSLFASSDCSAQVFSQQVGVAVPTLYAWRKKYSTRLVTPPFVEIKRQEGQEFQVKINGIDLYFRALPSAPWFSEVLKSLGA